jgi:hypothetical protein
VIEDISEELLASWSQRRYGGAAPRTFVQGEDGMYRIGTQDPATLPPQFNRMTAQGAAPISPDMPIPEPAPSAPTPSTGNQLLGGLADDLLNAFQGMPAGVLAGLQPAPAEIGDLLADDSVPIESRLSMATSMADRLGIQLGFRRAQPGPNGEQPLGAFEAVVIDPETASQLPQGMARGAQAVGSMINIGQIDPVAGTGAAIARGVQGVKGADTVMGMAIGPIPKLGEGAAKYIKRGNREYVALADGSDAIGEIGGDVAKAIGREAAPIRLSAEREVKINNDHSAHIKDVGYPDVTTFVADVTANYNAIYKANEGRIMLVKQNGSPKVAVVELGPSATDPSQWEVITALPARRSYLKGKDKIWESEAARRTAPPPRDDPAFGASGGTVIPPSGANSNGGAK